ncbi:MAG: tRNA-dihydrouridine synthase family protein [Desulfuromonadaceae bacterium]|nr:tRNA-dihydrouridine synthase family protein [Desulfuromonadaceae bacterium]
MQLPWEKLSTPLMLAPLQGLSNASMRCVQMELGAPDVLFSEFVAVNGAAKQRMARRDLEEVRAHCLAAPLVVQLVGNSAQALAEGASILQDNGVQHLNLNLGCPYGRMMQGNTGGGMLRDVHQVKDCLTAMRQVARGSFSVKVRSGYDNHGQIMELLPVFEGCGVDFIILHPRTVVQKYVGAADHSLTQRMVAATSLPVVANGDIVSADQGHAILKMTEAAGLMLGRGAISDPWLFARIRRQQEQGQGNEQTGGQVGACAVMQRRTELRIYLLRLHDAYMQAYSGDQQVLAKLKNVVQFVEDEALRRWCGKIKRSGTLRSFVLRVESLVDMPL